MATVFGDLINNLVIDLDLEHLSLLGVTDFILIASIEIVLTFYYLKVLNATE